MEYKLTVDEAADDYSYGVALFVGGVMTKSAPCISGRRSDMEQLAELLNGLEIEPCHFEDIIEDYLTDFTI